MTRKEAEQIRLIPESNREVERRQEALGGAVIGTGIGLELSRLILLEPFFPEYRAPLEQHLIVIAVLILSLATLSINDIKNLLKRKHTS